MVRIWDSAGSSQAAPERSGFNGNQHRGWRDSTENSHKHVPVEVQTLPFL